MWKLKYNELFSPFQGGNDMRKTNTQGVSAADNSEDVSFISGVSNDMVFSKPGRFSDPQEWQVIGQALYQQSNSLIVDRNKSSYIGYDATKSPSIRINVRKRGVDDSVGHGEILQCLGGINTRFWGDKKGAFCAYYLEEPGEGYDMYMQGFFRSGTLQVKVNDVPIPERQVKNYSPVCTSDTSSNGYKIAILFIERSDLSLDIDGDGDVLVINEYYINTTKSEELTVQRRSRRLRSTEERAYKYPLGAMRDSGGNIVVVCKVRGDYRVAPSDQGYFLWKFSGANLQLMSPRNIQHDHQGIYMFRRFGGSAIDDPEYLIIWGERGDFPFLSYVSRYLISRRSTYLNQYKSYDAVFYSDYNGVIRSPGQLDMKCMISTSQCNIDSRGIVLSGSNISNVRGITVAGIRYTFYVSKSYKTGQNLGFAMQDEGIFSVIEDFIPIKFSVSSLNVKHAGNDYVTVMLVERDSTFVHVYDVDLRQFMDALWYKVNSITFDYRSMDIDKFINAVSSGTRVILPGMREVVTTSEQVTIIKGHSVGIPVSTTKKHMLKIVKYHDVENFSVVSTVNESEERAYGDFTSVGLQAATGGITTQSTAVSGRTMRFTEIPPELVLSTSGLGETSSKNHKMHKGFNGGTANKVVSVSAKLEKGKIAPSKDADHVQTESTALAEYYASTHDIREFRGNDNSFYIHGTNVGSSNNTHRMADSSGVVNSASTPSSTRTAAITASAVTLIIAVAAGIIFLYTWYIRRKSMATRDAHRNAYRAERIRQLFRDNSTQLIVRSYGNVPSSDMCEIEETMTQMGCVSTSEL